MSAHSEHADTLRHLPGRKDTPRQEPVPFGPSSLLWELAGDHRANLVLAMPTLMQAMHPVIGDALRRMPVATTDPWGRLTRSLDSISLWIYGGSGAIEEGRRLLELHKPVKGRDTDGRDYSALKPEAWAWVVLSAYPAYLTMCRVFGEPLGAADQDRLYGEIQNLARILGVRERQIPATVADFWDYYDTMVSTRLVNHPYVHRVLDVIRRPPPPPRLPAVLNPAWHAVAPAIGRPNVWLVHGTFPPEVRRILDIQWTGWDEWRFRMVGQTIRRVSRITPEPLRYTQMPREARRLARAQASGGMTAGYRRRLAQRRLARCEAVMRARQTNSLTVAGGPG